MNWIKYSVNLHDKPRVQRIADELGISRFDAAGRLCAVWAWADTMTDTGRIAFGSLKQVDRAAEIDGFGEAMKAVGWLDQSGDDLVIPGWDEHHSKSAKKRATTAKRNARWRDSSDSKGTKRKRDATSVTGASPREEKNREEKSASANADADCAAAAASGLRFKSEVEAMVGRTGFPAPDGRTLDEIRKTIDRIESGEFPEAVGIADPLGHLETRLRWYWNEQAVRRKHAERRLEPPSLRKTLAEDRWRVNPDDPHWKPEGTETDDETRRLIDNT